MTHGIENQVLAQNRHANVEGVKTVTVIPSFDNMISNSRIFPEPLVTINSKK
jgi:hypothetical protein